MATLPCGWAAPPLTAAGTAAAGHPRRSTWLAPRRMMVPMAAATAQNGQRMLGFEGQTQHKALKDPAKLAGSSTLSVAVQDAGGSLSLDTYMRLPTEQYSELDPSMIFALGSSTFLLKVPRVQLFNVWLEPEVTVCVSLADSPPSVVFESRDCRLKGSDLVQRLGLDQRFVLYFSTALTWQSRSSLAANGGAAVSNGASAAGAGANGRQPAAAAAPASAAAGSSGTGQITAQSAVQVWSEVVGPFGAIPRGMLEATGNAVLGALMRALLPIFMNKLAADYQRWSTSPAYRARRAGAAAESATVAGGAVQQPPVQSAR